MGYGIAGLVDETKGKEYRQSLMEFVLCIEHIGYQTTDTTAEVLR
jgi:hypothetical protein